MSTFCPPRGLSRKSRELVDFKAFCATQIFHTQQVHSPYEYPIFVLLLLLHIALNLILCLLTISCLCQSHLVVFFFALACKFNQNSELLFFFLIFLNISQYVVKPFLGKYTLSYLKKCNIYVQPYAYIHTYKCIS